MRRFGQRFRQALTPIPSSSTRHNNTVHGLDRELLALMKLLLDSRLKLTLLMAQVECGGSRELEATFFWNPKRRWKPIRRDDAPSHRNMQTTETKPLSVSLQVTPGKATWKHTAINPPVNPDDLFTLITCERRGIAIPAMPFAVSDKLPCGLLVSLRSPLLLCAQL